MSATEAAAKPPVCDAALHSHRHFRMNWRCRHALQVTWADSSIRRQLPAVGFVHDAWCHPVASFGSRRWAQLRTGHGIRRGYSVKDMQKGGKNLSTAVAFVTIADPTQLTHRPRQLDAAGLILTRSSTYDAQTNG